MKLKDVFEVIQAWEKEVGHSDFRYLSTAHIELITNSLNDSLTARWKIGMTAGLQCPSCGKTGFRTLDIWSPVNETARLKCNKCGEWSLLIDWEAKTLSRDKVTA
jgi:hypothetical protein